ncbi:MAG: SH3 domain-containing protein [Sorangiineae bacterium]|nr:SH3 domain-containing protein [Polyangiaceae bacterium]MEB2322280.1 SH3 domain-containing protein [Sorangiineae bacterium]
MRTAALIVALLLSSAARPALGDEDTDVFARVVVPETELRSGPSVSGRVIYRAKRGEAFLVDGREGSGFWLRVTLPDGRTAYVLGDTVEALEAGPDSAESAVKPGVFAPPALEEAHAGFTLSGGVFDRDGYLEFDPAFVLAPAISLEPYVGLALQPDGRRLVYGAGGTLNLIHDWAVSPFVHLGAGGVHDMPSAEFFPTSRDFFHVRAGGGLLVSLRWRILVRLQAMNTVIFTEDSFRNAQSFTGGIGTYF